MHRSPGSSERIAAAARPAPTTRTTSVSAFPGDNLEPALFRSGGALLRVADNNTPRCPSARGKHSTATGIYGEETPIWALIHGYLQCHYWEERREKTGSTFPALLPFSLKSSPAPFALRTDGFRTQREFRIERVPKLVLP